MDTNNRQSTRPARVEHEVRLQRAVMAYIVAGILFMLLPGTWVDTRGQGVSHRQRPCVTVGVSGPRGVLTSFHSFTLH